MGNAILGDVTATSGDIDSIIVYGGSATGIRGDIQAPNGHIRSIWTTGQIGTSSVTPKIWAGEGIEEIIARNTALGSVLPVDFHADVRSNAIMAADPTGYPFNRPDIDGELSLLETKGNFRGTIRAGNIGRPAVPFARTGIFVNGILDAPIIIDRNVWLGNIVARTFLQDITIGHFMKGAVVATGGATPPVPTDPAFIDGHIKSITVGRSGYRPDDDSSSSYRYSGPGMSGTDQPVFSPASPLAWFDFADNNLNDGGAIDGVIKAYGSIGTVDVASMSLKFESNCKQNAPRIEAPVIGSLTVSDLRIGSIWSGLDDGSAGNDPTNDYATIGEVDIGCVGVAGAVWMQDWSAATFGNVFGSVHVPEIAPTQVIHIARHLGDLGESIFGSTGSFAGEDCACVADLHNDSLCLTQCFNLNTESTPRNPAFVVCSTSLRHPIGRVWVRDDFAGQVVVNGAGETTAVSDYWTGIVEVGVDGTDPTCPEITLADDETSPDTSPYYTRPLSDFAGGAVGLAPFHLYGTDCEPPHDPVGADTGIDEAVLNGLGGQVLIRFYGPIQRKNAAQAWYQHIKIKARPFPQPCPPPFAEQLNPCLWIDVTTAFNVEGPTSTTTNALARRTLKLTPKNGNYVAPGIYMVHPTAGDSVRCADVAGNPTVIWSFLTCDEEEPAALRGAYGFVVFGDCDSDNVPDQDDCDLGPGCTTSCNTADFNHSGTITVQDIFDFLNAYFNGCAGDPNPPCNGDDADINNSGSVTVQDIFDYLAAYFGATGC